MPVGAAMGGPLVVYRDAGTDTGPSMFDRGVMIADPRFPFNYQPGSASGGRGWVNSEVLVIDTVPSALQPNNIAASQSPGAGAINLVSTSGAGITVGVSLTNSLTGALVTGLLAIDNPQTPVVIGPIQAWDPNELIGRAVRIVSGGSDSGITFTIRGFDIYGFPMTESFAGAAIGTATGKKAFKYIQSVTHTGSVAGTVTVGTTDIIGLPFRMDNWGYANIVVANAFISANTGFVAADTTTPATATTGDVRGTYTLQTPSNGTTNRLIVTQWIAASNLGADTGMFGVAQFSG